MKFWSLYLPSKIKFDKNWILFIIVARLAMFTFFAYEFQKNGPLVTTFFASSGDTETYYGPLENLVKGFGYSATYHEDGIENTKVNAYRMPGLLPIFSPFAYLFGINIAKNIVIFLQLFTGIVAVYVLSKTAEMIFESRLSFKLVAVFYSLSTFVFVFDHYGLSESFHISFLIFSIFFLVRYLKEKSYSNLILGGFFLTWSLFMRPVIGVFFPLILFILLVDAAKKDALFIKSYFKIGIVFVLPLCFFLSIWTARNYYHFKQFIPLQMPLDEGNTAYPAHRLAIYDLIIAQGEDITHWVNGSLGQWFMKEGTQFNLNKLAYTETFNKDSIINLKKYYHLSRNDDYLKLKIIESSAMYVTSLKKEKPFFYFVTAKLKLLRSFLFPTQYSIPLPFPQKSEMNVFELSIKSLSFLFLYFITVIGIVGIVISYFKRMEKAKLISLFPISLLFTLCGLIGYIELRYYAPVYIFMLLFSAFAIEAIWIKMCRRKQVSIANSSKENKD